MCSSSIVVAASKNIIFLIIILFYIVVVVCCFIFIFCMFPTVVSSASILLDSMLVFALVTRGLSANDFEKDIKASHNWVSFACIAIIFCANSRTLYKNTCRDLRTDCKRPVHLLANFVGTLCLLSKYFNEFLLWLGSKAKVTGLSPTS